MFFFDLVYLNLVTCGIGIISLLIPLLVFHFDKDDQPFDDPAILKHFESVEFKICGAALLVSSCPVILDVFIDFFTKSLSSIDRRCLLGRLCIGTVTFLAGLQFASKCAVWELFPSYLMSYWFALWSLRIVYFASIMSFLSSLNQTLFSVKETCVLTFFLILFVSIRFNAYCFQINWLDDVSGALIDIWSFCFITIMCWWGYKLLCLRPTWKKHDYSCLLYWILLFVMNGIGTTIVIALDLIPSKSNLLEDNASENIKVLFPIYVYVVTSIIFCVVPGQIARYASVATKDEIIATKQAYVRYISHELRTPMNTIKMGVKFCLTKIPKNTTDSNEKVARETLEETNSAIDVALEILNDLLLYDKLESGLVSLSKEIVGTADFVSQCIKMFAVQIRARKLNLIFINEDSSSSLSSIVDSNNFQLVSGSEDATSTNLQTEPPLMAIHSYDKCLVDKSKLSQVVRNIMSNAIKFTPDNGTIKIRVGFLIGASIPIMPESVTQSSNSCCDVVHLVRFFNFLKGNLRPTRLFGNEMSYSQISTNTTAGTVPSDSDLETGLSDESNNHMSANIQHGLLVIEIKDSGAGISSENQHKLFDEIVQFDPERLQAGGGSGLGLWISKAIVDMHGGRINVHSEGEGFGSTFRLEIPMTRDLSTITSSSDTLFTFNTRQQRIRSNQLDDTDTKPEVQVDIFTESSSHLVATIKKMHMLIVDDSKSNRKMLSKFLKDRGHTYEEAENGLIAVDMVKASMNNIRFNDDGSHRQYYDAILMDFVMPKMTGPQATSAIRALNYSLPIIGITGNATKADHDIFTEAGADKVLNKPLDIELLWETIKDT